MSSLPAPRMSRYPHATPSPPTKSVYDLTPLSGLLEPPDHSKKAHDEKLADALAKHDTTRNTANEVLYNYEKQRAQDIILERTRLINEAQRIAERNRELLKAESEAQEKRLQAEEAARAEEQRARELTAKTIPPLPPVQKPIQQAQQQPAAKPAPAWIAAPESTPDPKANDPFSNKVASTPVTTASAVSAPAVSAPAPALTTPAAAATNAPPQDSRAERFSLIHKNLKELRKDIDTQNASNPAMKNSVGDARREIRKLVGQLSLEKKANTPIMSKVNAILRQALLNQAASNLVDPSHFVFDNRQPMDGAAHNAELPSVFLFLLNHFAKAIVKQFINECAVNTKAADPIGVLVALIFSDPNFHWRGKPLIDILMAKYRAVCPVLFGARGNKEADKKRMGWPDARPDDPSIEGYHLDRQIGLAAGYASIALRDFSKSKKSNPYPMHHYWEAFATIVNTPPLELSHTSCVVLKALIDGNEPRFLQFYGNAALAALRLALVDLPVTAKDTKGVQQLVVLARTINDKYGLSLT